MNKVVVITGGTDGLGKAIAKELINDDLIIISNNKEKLVETSNELNCDYRLCDVANYNDVYNTINSIINIYGKIDVLINCAGVWLVNASMLIQKVLYILQKQF